MGVFLKTYWAYLLLVIGFCGLAVNYFLSNKIWMGIIWLTVAMTWFNRLCQKYQQDQKNK
ncbi:hypothetical protein [Streptococcus merionis]|uniref:hypothetical protein n=1 Tax=Streptococcus merionis TaxID=400065 RepID=UPI003513B367